MKKFIKVILGIVFVPLFLLLVAVFTAKIYFLSADFWKGVYTQEFYDRVSQILKVQEEEILIDPKVLKDAADKNIIKVIDFLSGKNPKLLVYIPQEFEFTFAGDEVPLPTLLERYTQVDQSLIAEYSYLERTEFYLSVLLVAIAAILLIFFLIAGRTSGIYLIVGGLSLLLAAGFINFIKIQWIRDLLPKNEGVAVIGVPLMEKISGLWMNYSFGILALGVSVIILGKKLKKKN